MKNKAKELFANPRVEADLFEFLSRGGEHGLAACILRQHSLHESRRWSVMELAAAVDLEKLTEDEKLFIQNAGRAELTTKPGADRLSNLCDKECRRWQPHNPIVANIMQACGTWSRYWNEEESHHETAFSYLETALGLDSPSDAHIIEYRKIFPDDDMLRTLTLLAFSEITAAVQYAHVARKVQEPNLAKLLKQIAADEIQHMKYFISFAKALVKSGEYGPKGAFAIAHLYLREDGELRGSSREHIQSRDSHVNWWDNVESRNEQIDLRVGLDKKEQMIYNALEEITGIRVASPAEVETTWMDLVAC